MMQIKEMNNIIRMSNIDSKKDYGDPKYEKSQKEPTKVQESFETRRSQIKAQRLGVPKYSMDASVYSPLKLVESNDRSETNGGPLVSVKQCTLA